MRSGTRSLLCPAMTRRQLRASAGRVRRPSHGVSREEVGITARWHGGKEIPAYGVAPFGHAGRHQVGLCAGDHRRQVKEHATQGRVGVENRNQGRPVPPPDVDDEVCPGRSAIY